MKHIICIVGKTGRGKDTLADIITDRLGIRKICSYATRPMRDYEEDGVQHWFITKERASEILATQTVLSYVRKPSGVEYFATAESIDVDKAIYIIDPDGVEYLKENFSDKFKFFVVELYAEDKEIEERVLLRGDNMETYLQRSANEHEEFEDFHNNEKYDISILSMLTKQQVYEKFVQFYYEWLDKNGDQKD